MAFDKQVFSAISTITPTKAATENCHSCLESSLDLDRPRYLPRAAEIFPTQTLREIRHLRLHLH